jgi:hypothetical protein
LSSRSGSGSASLPGSLDLSAGWARQIAQAMAATVTQAVSPAVTTTPPPPFRQVDADANANSNSNSNANANANVDGKASMADRVLDPAIPAAQRREELSRLTHEGALAIPQLAKIASAETPKFPNELAPHSVDESRAGFERGLRVTALEQLDHLGIRQPELKAEIEKVLAAQRNDPMLSLLARVSLLGFQEGRPGKLSRFINKTFDQFEDEISH